MKTKQVENLKKVVIDDGSNFIKFCSKNDNNEINTFSLPSRVIRKAMPSANASGFSDASYEIDSERFSVSKTAIGVIPTNNRQYQTSKHNRVLIHHALKQANISGEIEVITTLPIGQFFNPDGSRNEPLIRQKIDNVKGEIKHLDNTDSVIISSCYVLPEAVPAFIYAKTELELTGERYLLVDIGGTTTDLAVINSDNQIEKFESLNIGALRIITNFANMVCEKLQLSELTDELAIQGLLKKKVAGEDVTDIADKVISEFEVLVNEAAAGMGELRLFDGVIFSGGGANLLKSEYINVLKTKEPQFDNAKGALLILS